MQVVQKKNHPDSKRKQCSGWPPLHIFSIFNSLISSEIIMQGADFSAERPSPVCTSLPFKCQVQLYTMRVSNWVRAVFFHGKSPFTQGKYEQGLYVINALSPKVDDNDSHKQIWVYNLSLSKQHLPSTTAFYALYDTSKRYHTQPNQIILKLPGVQFT